jgi:hypothetical protein
VTRKPRRCPVADNAGFTKIRNGLREHVKQGKLPMGVLGLYVYLHMECNWQTGIYHGTALGIAFGFSDSGSKAMVNKNLSHLKKNGYIRATSTSGKVMASAVAMTSS